MFLEKFNEYRREHLTTQQNYKRYKKWLLKHKPDNFKLEVNMCKYFVTGSKRFLKKNLKILDKMVDTETKDTQTYKLYVEAYINQNEESILSAWNAMNENTFLFFFNVDLLSLNNDNFELQKYFTHWNDIELQFDSEHHKKYLMNLQNTIDFRFNSQLAQKCFAFEELKESCYQAIKEDKNCMLKFKEFDLFLDGFKAYLEDNFVGSEFVKAFCDDFKRIYCKLLGNQFVQTTPLCFSEFQSEINKISKEVVGAAERKQIIMSELRKMVEVKKIDHPLPFLPVFYDLAYDYIEYPDVEELTEHLAAINIKK